MSDTGAGVGFKSANLASPPRARSNNSVFNNAPSTPFNIQVMMPWRIIDKIHRDGRFTNPKFLDEYLKAIARLKKDRNLSPATVEELAEIEAARSAGILNNFVKNFVPRAKLDLLNKKHEVAPLKAYAELFYTETFVKRYKKYILEALEKHPDLSPDKKIKYAISHAILMNDAPSNKYSLKALTNFLEVKNKAAAKSAAKAEEARLNPIDPAWKLRYEAARTRRFANPKFRKAYNKYLAEARKYELISSEQQEEYAEITASGMLNDYLSNYLDAANIARLEIKNKPILTRNNANAKQQYIKKFYNELKESEKNARIERLWSYLSPRKSRRGALRPKEAANMVAELQHNKREALRKALPFEPVLLPAVEEAFEQVPLPPVKNDNNNGNNGPNTSFNNFVPPPPPRSGGAYRKSRMQKHNITRRKI